MIVRSYALDLTRRRALGSDKEMEKVETQLIQR